MLELLSVDWVELEDEELVVDVDVVDVVVVDVVVHCPVPHSRKKSNFAVNWVAPAVTAKIPMLISAEVERTITEGLSIAVQSSSLDGRDRE